MRVSLEGMDDISLDVINLADVRKCEGTKDAGYKDDKSTRF